MRNRATSFTDYRTQVVAKTSLLRLLAIETCKLRLSMT